MIIVKSTDLVKVVTATGADVDVHASWVDLTGTTAAPGRTNTQITTATTTTRPCNPPRAPRPHNSPSLSRVECGDNKHDNRRNFSPPGNSPRGLFFALAPPPRSVSRGTIPPGPPCSGGFVPVRGNSPGLWVHNAREFKTREMRDYKRPRWQSGKIQPLAPTGTPLAQVP